MTGHFFRFYCANEACQKPLETNNRKKLYCSEECRKSAKNSRWLQDHEKENAARAAAWRIAARKKGEHRNCHQCGRQFQAYDHANAKPQRFCCQKCVAAYASTFAASWRRYPKKGNGHMNGKPAKCRRPSPRSPTNGAWCVNRTPAATSA